VRITIGLEPHMRLEKLNLEGKFWLVSTFFLLFRFLLRILYRGLTRSILSLRDHRTASKTKRKQQDVRDSSQMTHVESLGAMPAKRKGELVRSFRGMHEPHRVPVPCSSRDNYVPP
jgi:hypothetical protein